MRGKVAKTMRKRAYEEAVIGLFHISQVNAVYRKRKRARNKVKIASALSSIGLSKKMHKNESLPDFKKRRAAANKRKRAGKNEFKLSLMK